MTEYQVTINLNSITYELEAGNEDEAIALASRIAMGENTYDLLKSAYYDVEEVE
jgi:hypothetical protein